MKKINNNELKKIVAGSISGWTIAGIVAGITFLVGIFDGYTRPFNCRQGGNMKLNNKELKLIVGGASISASLIDSLIKGVNSFLDIGRYLGSSIRRFIGGNMCGL